MGPPVKVVALKKANDVQTTVTRGCQLLNIK